MDLTILDEYDIICPIGAESLKYACKETGVTKYNGTLIKDRIFPILDPSYITFKPQYEEDVKKAINFISFLQSGKIIDYIFMLFLSAIWISLVSIFSL